MRASGPSPFPRLDARTLAAAGVLILVTSVAYFPCLHGGFIFDDTGLLTQNPLIKSADGLYRFWFTTQAIDYWPVFNSALWLQWRMWGMDPTGYHVTNLALHIINALLIGIVLWRLSVPGAFLTALLFAVHPVNVESVAWIAQLKGLLAMFFSLLAVLAFLHSDSRSSADAAALPRGALRWYGLSVLGLVLAMLSKGSAVVVPWLLLVILWWLRRLERRNVVRVGLLVLITAAFVPLNLWFRARFETAAPSTGIIERLLGAAAALWFYVYKALLPVRLSFLYPKWQVRTDQLHWWLPLLAAVACTGLLVRYRRGWSRPVLVGWVFFIVALAPVIGLSGSGLMQQFSVADHYQYVALIGVVALLAAAAARWQASARVVVRRSAQGLAVAVAGIFVVLTWRQSGLYGDAITLYRASLRNSPDSALAHHNLGLALYDASRLDEAAAQFEAALRLRPDYDEAHKNLGLTLLKAGKLDAALAHFNLAVQASPSNAWYRYQIGAALAETQHLSLAIEQLQAAVRLNPNDPEAQNDLGSVLFQMGQQEEGNTHFEAALRLDPQFPEANQNVGRARLRAGRFEEAIVLFRRALSHKPELPHINDDLGVALAEAGRTQEAIEQFRAALRADPNDAGARANLQEVLGTSRAAGPQLHP